jgi:hypothetical protein
MVFINDSLLSGISRIFKDFLKLREENQGFKGLKGFLKLET